jgi:cytochrome c peroxidase
MRREFASAFSAVVTGVALLAAPPVPLGRYLFYDRRLSGNGTQSCATCHRQELAFTDGRARAVGSTGEAHARSAMSLVNVASAATLTWADPRIRSLEQQAMIPLYRTKPIELGLKDLKALEADPVYREFAPLTIAKITRALADFERTIISARSPYDRFHYQGQQDAISDSAKRGEALFFTDGVAGCFRCHNGPNFTDGGYHNTALYPMQGKFKTPTLRNIALTAPYMHDGSIATLEEVVDHYAAGGRAKANREKDSRMTGFVLTEQNKKDLLAFLNSLTDLELTRDPRFSDPWPH